MSEQQTVTSDRVWNDFAVQLRRFIADRVRAEADVDDILQEVFVKIHRGIDGLGEQSKLRAWVYQITRNAIIDQYRRGERSVEITGELPEVCTEGAADDGVGAEVATCLRPLMEELPEKYREALRLTEIEGLTQNELAERLNLSLSGAKSRVQRAREKLKDVLLACCHVEVDRRGKVVGWELKRTGCPSCTVTLIRK